MKLMKAEKEAKNCQMRLEEIKRNIRPSKMEFYENNKRNEFSTIFDDKKTLARSPDSSTNVYDVKIRSSQQQINPNNYHKNLLPTTSLAYGYHSINNNNYY